MNRWYKLDLHTEGFKYLLSNIHHWQFRGTGLKRPILCCPNDHDDAKLLSGVTGKNIDEIFIGSDMTNIGHFIGMGELLDRASSVNTRFWICLPTRMDAHKLMEETYYTIYCTNGARTKMP